MKYYLLGIGGIGMSAVARYLNQAGNQVFGYDRVQTDLTIQLEKEGMCINYTDNPCNVPNDIDYAVYTPAIPSDNKQLQKIKSLDIPLKKRSEILGQITKDKKVIAVSGTHGKTTTTGMIAAILSHSPIGCSAFVGGILKNEGTNFIYNQDSDYVVAEADEYDRSFLRLNPYVSIITSIEEDHMDIYHTYQALQDAFVEFANKTYEDGLILLKYDKRNIIKDITKSTTMQTYSLTDTGADNYMQNLRISNGSYYFDYIAGDFKLYDLQICCAGLHNVENAVAAVTVCRFVLKKEGLDTEETGNIIRGGLKDFGGIKRRLEFRIKTKDRIFVDDYAHHPQELCSSIDSLRQLYPQKHLTGIFQPHLYSRTRDLADGFAKALEKLDTVILLPIYPAREEPIMGVDSHLILHKINKMDKYLVTKQQLLPLIEALNPTHLVAFGAGDIDKLVSEVENKMKELMNDE